MVSPKPGPESDHQSIADLPNDGSSAASNSAASNSAAARDSTTQQGSMKELLRVSLPLMISAGSHSLMTLIDRVMLARYEPAADDAATTLDIIAAVTPASMLHWTLLCVPLGTVLYANTFIAQYDGAKDSRRMMVSFFQAIWLAVLAGLLMVAFVPIAEPLFDWVGHSPAVIQEELKYFQALCAFSVIPLIATALSCFFSGRRQTKVVMMVNVSCLLINIALDAALIFGQWGFPMLGIQGAAIATLGAELGHIVLYGALIILAIRKNGEPVATSWKLNLQELKQYFCFGLPSGVHFFVDISGFFVFLLLVGRLNVDSLAATNIAFSINGLIFIPLLGFGTAVQTLVGHHLGAKCQADAARTTWNGVRLGFLWTGPAALFLIFFPDIALLPFVASHDGSSSVDSIRNVLPLVKQLLIFVAIYSVFDALAVVFASALRGAGDSFFPMLLTLVSSWLVMVVPAWLLVQSGQGTVNLLWMTCTAHISLMGLGMLLRFLSGRWKAIDLTSSPAG
ncbi:MAG: MATE family efflux transporter [Fuerstiella sp.]